MSEEAILLHSVMCVFSEQLILPTDFPDMELWEAIISSLHTLKPFSVFGSGIIPFQGLTNVNVGPIMLCAPEQAGVTSETVSEAVSGQASPTLRI